MTEEKQLRINELARKSKTPEGLTEQEKAEQKVLRDEYIAEYRRNLMAQLDNTYIERPDGTREKIVKKQ